MAVFRIQEHTPDVYPRKSRDFQLYSVLFDCLNGGLKYDIDSIRDIIDTNQCNERLIPYLQTKLGFFTKLKIPTDKLRTILKAFPEIVKNKGSLHGIQQAVEVFIKVERIDSDIRVSIDNKRYAVQISTSKQIDNYDILKEILRYVMPAGYFLEFLYRVPGGMGTYITYSDRVNIVSADPLLNGGLRLDSESVEPISDVGTSTIIRNNKTPSSNKDGKYTFGTFRRENLWES